MNIKKSIGGLGVALVTPFNDEGEVDFHALRGIVDYVVANGSDFLVALGTTGETPTLSAYERDAVVDAVLCANNGVLPVVAGVGGNSTREVCKGVGVMSQRGVNAILSVTPYYNKPSQEGLFYHFCEVAGASSLPVIMYNVPSRTGVNMHASTTIRIADKCSNVVAIKESAGDMVQVAEIIKYAAPGFSVLSGDDVNTLNIMSLGGSGVISVVGNALPALMAGLVRAVANGDSRSAAEVHLKLLDIIGLIFREGNPAGIKALMELMGFCGNRLRLPLTPVSVMLYEQIRNELQKININ